MKASNLFLRFRNTSSKTLIQQYTFLYHLNDTHHGLILCLSTSNSHLYVRFELLYQRVLLNQNQRHSLPVYKRPLCRYTWLIEDRKSTRLNSSHVSISYAVFCLKKKTGRNTIILR